MAKFCAWCGQQIEDGDVFCGNCGRRADGSDAAAQQPRPTPQQPTPQQPQQPQQWQTPAQRAPQQNAWTAPPPPQQQWQQPQAPRQPQWQPPQQQWQPTPPPKKGGKAGLAVGIVALALVVIVGVGGFVWPGFFKKSEGAPVDKPKTEQTAPTAKPIEAPKATDAPALPDAPKATDAPKPIATPEPTQLPTEAPYQNPFTDVTESDWYYDAVMWAGKNGIVTGSLFQPAEAASRGQALTFLWRAAGEPVSKLKNSPYADVTEGDWYYMPVLWGFENGIISTAADGQFHADGTLTRAQAITFLCRAAEGQPRGSARSFADVREGDWYFDVANWALENGVVGRDDSWAFHPNETVTRAQLITFMYRAMDPAAKLSGTAPPLQKGFRDLGITQDVDDFGPKQFQTVTSSGETVTFNAEVSDYQVFEESDGFPLQDGREYRVMTLHLWTDNTTTGRHYLLSVLESNYYNIALYKDSTVSEDNGVTRHTVIHNGAPAEMTVWWRNEAENRDGQHHILITWTASVPKGFDGLVVGARHRNINASGLYLNEYYTSDNEFALFRMK